jgi:hypothetical protein
MFCQQEITAKCTIKTHCSIWVGGLAEIGSQVISIIGTVESYRRQIVN